MGEDGTSSSFVGRHKATMTLVKMSPSHMPLPRWPEWKGREGCLLHEGINVIASLLFEQFGCKVRHQAA